MNLARLLAVRFGSNAKSLPYDEGVISSKGERRVQGDPRGPGGPPYNKLSKWHCV